jgi:hypothetical protein
MLAPRRRVGKINDIDRRVVFVGGSLAIVGNFCQRRGGDGEMLQINLKKDFDYSTG